jgi:hypothetical protein
MMLNKVQPSAKHSMALKKPLWPGENNTADCGSDGITY